MSRISVLTFSPLTNMLAGCEYGDRVKGCKAYHCNMVTTDDTVLKECCQTCSYGVKIMTSEKPSYTLSPITTEKTVETSSSQTCYDRATVNGQTCHVFVSNNGRHVCYDNRLQHSCCKTCVHFKEDKNEGKVFKIKWCSRYF